MVEIARKTARLSGVVKRRLKSGRCGDLLGLGYLRSHLVLCGASNALVTLLAGKVCLGVRTGFRVRHFPVD